ncbi:MAG: hypothetical protein F7C35_03010 [Desulfurococcales archaeon]|nr:hypothetical protein [Desulfurococcales archaeon]
MDALRLLGDGASLVAAGALLSWLGLTGLTGSLLIISRDLEVGIAFLVSLGLILSIVGYGVYVYGLVKWRDAGRKVLDSLGRRFEWGLKGASYMWKGLLSQLAGLPLMAAGMIFLVSDNDVLASLFVFISIILVVSGLIAFIAGSTLFGVFLSRLENVTINETYEGLGLTVAGALLAVGSFVLPLQLVAALLIRSLARRALAVGRGPGVNRHVVE